MGKNVHVFKTTDQRSKFSKTLYILFTVCVSSLVHSYKENCKRLFYCVNPPKKRDGGHPSLMEGKKISELRQVFLVHVSLSHFSFLLHIPSSLLTSFLVSLYSYLFCLSIPSSYITLDRYWSSPFFKGNQTECNLCYQRKYSL